ncbi:MAG TPA: ribosome biogenesis GTP-binding protein YihA/YsxC [Alphaproteobacteria bacterium]
MRIRAKQHPMDKLFLGEAAFFWGAETPDDLPPPERPEVAFAGRSNVGKSSLINALTGRKNMVRTSNTPGQTRALNFFNIGDHFTLVDMPGYGFAKASKVDQKKWQGMMKAYLRGRVNLRLACVLVDSRHGLKDSDHEMLKLLSDAAVPTRLVLTKSDEISASDKEKAVAALTEAVKKIACAHPVPVITSSKKEDGISDLRAAIVETLGLHES